VEPGDEGGNPRGIEIYSHSFHAALETQFTRVRDFGSGEQLLIFPSAIGRACLDVGRPLGFTHPERGEEQGGFVMRLELRVARPEHLRRCHCTQFPFRIPLTHLMSDSPHEVHLALGARGTGPRGNCSVIPNSSNGGWTRSELATKVAKSSKAGA